MAKPKFTALMTDKENQEMMRFYHALPRRQKVKWRKAVHKVLKEKKAQENHEMEKEVIA